MWLKQQSVKQVNSEVKTRFVLPLQSTVSKYHQVRVLLQHSLTKVQLWLYPNKGGHSSPKQGWPQLTQNIPVLNGEETTVEKVTV